MPYDKAPHRNFFYKVSYKNPSPALPILLADFTKLFSSIAIFGIVHLNKGDEYNDDPPLKVGN